MSTSVKLPDDDPRMIAWEELKKSNRWSDMKNFITDERFQDGVLWTAFIAGYVAGKADAN